MANKNNNNNNDNNNNKNNNNDDNDNGLINLNEIKLTNDQLNSLLQLNSEAHISRQGGFKLYFPANPIRFMILKGVEVAYLNTDYGLLYISNDHDSADNIRKMLEYHDVTDNNKLMLKIKFYNDDDVIQLQKGTTCSIVDFFHSNYSKGDKLIVDVAFHLSFMSEKQGKQSVTYK
eukprot:Pgem_evm1s12679